MVIIVVGTNLDGIHAGGAAKFAHLNHGLAMGIAEGLSGTAYALPTVGHNFSVMLFGEVFEHIRTFHNFARIHPELQFQITRIGCGIAGFKDSEIAPVFVDAPKNCLFDGAWREYLPSDAQFWAPSKFSFTRGIQ